MWVGHGVDWWMVGRMPWLLVKPICGSQASSAGDYCVGVGAAVFMAIMLI